MTAIVLRGDAAHLPLPDASVDLIVTSPPYWGMRSYTDGGEHYDGQIGSEEMPREWLEALWRCTAEWMRVLKPEGSLFVDLGDKYSQPGKGERNMQGIGGTVVHKVGVQQMNRSARDFSYDGVRGKSLLGLPWRYAIGCVDGLGLILRAEIVWEKPNGLPESVTDRVRRSHEQVFHFVKQPRYFAAVDEIREPHTGNTHGRRADGQHSPKEQATIGNGFRRGYFPENPLGKLPGSVWGIPSMPLTVPAHLGVDHFAAFPVELPRRIILGWSPSGICIECGEGRCPVVVRAQLWTGRVNSGRAKRQLADGIGLSRGHNAAGYPHTVSQTAVTGYACACAPYTDHPGTGKPTRRVGHNTDQPTFHPQGTYGQKQAGEYERVGPWREYHLEDWTPPPTRPSVVVDPFAGTGTTMLTASVLGRIGIGIDRSGDYCRLARWRCSDPAERARALGVPKPPPVPEGQGSLFDELEAS